MVTILTMLAATGGADPFYGAIYQAVAAAVVFLVVLVVLKKVAWSKIIQGLADRENKIRSDLESAERSARQAESTLAEYQAKLTEAHVEVRTIIEQGNAAAQKLSEQIKQQAQEDIERTRQRVTTDIQSAKEQALNDIYAQAATLATDVAGRILQRQISDDDQQRLVQDAISRLQKSTQN